MNHHTQRGRARRGSDPNTAIADAVALVMNARTDPDGVITIINGMGMLEARQTAAKLAMLVDLAHKADPNEPLETWCRALVDYFRIESRPE